MQSAGTFWLNLFIQCENYSKKNHYQEITAVSYMPLLVLCLDALRTLHLMFML